MARRHERGEAKFKAISLMTAIALAPLPAARRNASLSNERLDAIDSRLIGEVGEFD
jgi:hypothetical protein